jgi:hypothetical protein
VDTHNTPQKCKAFVYPVQAIAVEVFANADNGEVTLG